MSEKQQWVKIRKKDLMNLQETARRSDQYYEYYQNEKTKAAELEGRVRGMEMGREFNNREQQDIIRKLLIIIGGFCPNKNPMIELETLHGGIPPHLR